jgi:hypothetical protein
MKLKIEIRRNGDGAVATDMWENYEHHGLFWWSRDGNAGCDCNRELFFCRAMGADEPEDPACGYGKYSIRLTNCDTAEVLLDEIDANETH